MAKSNNAHVKPWGDPDDAPELDEDHFSRADIYEGAELVKRGRPKLAAPKQLVSLRLDPVVVAWLRNSGRGWQTRAANILKDAVLKGLPIAVELTKKASPAKKASSRGE